jgi:hypothetical protein
MAVVSRQRLSSQVLAAAIALWDRPDAFSVTAEPMPDGGNDRSCVMRGRTNTGVAGQLSKAGREARGALFFLWLARAANDSDYSFAGKAIG